MDFGNTELVETMDVRKLPEQYLKLPQQAIHCKLSAVEPKSPSGPAAAMMMAAAAAAGVSGPQWSKDAIRYMNKLIMKPMTLCHLGRKEEDKHCIDLRMCQGAGDQAGQGQFVSDLLVQAQFANKIQGKL